MSVKVDYKQILGEVKERNRFFKALKEIQEIAENTNENNFEAQSELIGEMCKQTLSCPNTLSKKMEEFAEDYEVHQETILSGEIYERFQI